MSGPGKIFDVLNARYSDPYRVAETFIPPEQYNQLRKPGNSLLVGARGTGKTTLLKMLKVSAIEAMNNTIPQRDAVSADYVSAFVANDRNWSSRISDFAAQLESQELQDFARRAIYLNECLRAIMKTASEVLQSKTFSQAVGESQYRGDYVSAEANFAQKAGLFLFDDGYQFSTADLDIKLNRRALDLINDVNSRRATGTSETEIASRNKWIFDDFLSPLSMCANMFNENLGIGNTRWCLSFDELELAPADIRNMLFSFLRGADPLFYFKLAIVPLLDDVSAFQAEAAPKSVHDYDVIELWNVRKAKKNEFMYRLANSTIRNAGLPDATVEQILGRSERVFYDRGDGKYSNDSAFFLNFIELADNDPTFRAYMAKRNMGIHDFYRMNEEQRAALFRKIQAIVLVRNSFWKKSRPSNSRSNIPVRRRPSSRSFVYSGSDVVVEMCDNNPRFLLAVLEPLIAEFSKDGKRVGADSQLDAIRQVSNQIFAVLRGEGIHPKYMQVGSVYDLVSRIGESFKNEIHGEEFNADPVLSFTVPEDASPSISRAIAYGLREGAFLLEGQYDGSYLRDGVRDKRLRLTYLFAPEFTLPLMLGRQRQLDTILRGRVSKKRYSNPNQPDFFGKA